MMLNTKLKGKERWLFKWLNSASVCKILGVIFQHALLNLSLYKLLFSHDVGRVILFLKSFCFSLSDQSLDLVRVGVAMEVIEKETN